MSLRSDPKVTPESPDREFLAICTAQATAYTCSAAVTRNQPNPEEINSGKSTGTEAMPGNYPRSPKDSEFNISCQLTLTYQPVATSSGGYSAPPESVWSNRSQRGTEEPVHSEAGLIQQATDGTRLDNELQDAKQGRDKNHGP